MENRSYRAGQAVYVEGYGSGTVLTDSRGLNTVNVGGQNWRDAPQAFPIEWVRPAMPAR